MSNGAEDEAAYAEAFGVSIEEARLVTEFVEYASETQQVLAERYPGQFGGMFIEHDPARLTLAWKGDRRALVFTDLRPDLSVVTVAYTQAELIEIQEQALAALRAEDVPIDSWIDLTTNRVIIATSERDDRAVVEALDRSDLELDVAASRVDGSETVMRDRIVGADPLEIHTGAELISDDAVIHAGFSTRTCTAGFNVRHVASRVHHLTTAGHCNNSQTFTNVRANQTISSTFLLEYWSGSRDIQFHSASTPNTSKPARLCVGSSSSRIVTGVKSRNATVLGEPVCKYGKTTGNTCGVVISTVATGASPANAATYIRVRNTGSRPLGSPGDSGGPWYTGGTALGWHKAGTDGQTSIYMSVSYLPPTHVVVTG